MLSKKRKSNVILKNSKKKNPSKNDKLNKLNKLNKLDNTIDTKTQVHCNLPNDQLSHEELVLIQKRMYPKQYSDSGFLKNGEILKDVIKKDSDTLKKLDITYKQIVDRLNNISAQYFCLMNLVNDEKKNISYGLLLEKDARYIKRVTKTNTNKYVYMIEDNLLVSSVSYHGAQECPFQNKDIDDKYHGYEYGSTDITIINTSLNESFTINTLVIHMIDKHHFFEGSVPNRVDPELLVRVLNIEQNVNYAPKYKYCYEWNFKGSRNFYEENSLWEDSADIAKNILAMKHYSYDYFTTTIRKKSYDKSNETKRIHAFLSGDYDLPNNLRCYVEGYEKKMTYERVRRKTYTKLNKLHHKWNSKNERYDDHYFEIKSRNEINRLCKKHGIMYEKFRSSNDTKKICKEHDDNEIPLYLHVFTMDVDQISLAAITDNDSDSDSNNDNDNESPKEEFRIDIFGMLAEVKYFDTQSVFEIYKRQYVEV
jgi:hypothetical protein